MSPRRRALVAGAVALPLAGCAPAAVQRFPDLASARQAVEGLRSGWRSTGGFDLAQMLNHAAQSVEFSRSGFPEAKSALFQNTLGTAAFAVFEARGTMNHGLAEPIPGAPALPAGGDLPAAIARLLKSLQDFEEHTGPLAPHFAYGTLDKSRYTRAHLMHLANHWTELVRT